MAVDLWKSPALVPILPYQDVPVAVDWLTRAYGFKERSEARLTWDGGCRAWMDVGDSLIILTTSGGHDVTSPGALGGMSQSLKVYVANIDSHFMTAEAAGAVIVSGLEDGFWGGRIYRTKDIEGHLWQFSQRDKDLPATMWKLPPGLRRGP
ncbi:MAG: VOC family protein [Methylocella sp.]